MTGATKVCKFNSIELFGIHKRLAQEIAGNTQAMTNPDVNAAANTPRQGLPFSELNGNLRSRSVKGRRSHRRFLSVRRRRALPHALAPTLELQ